VAKYCGFGFSSLVLVEVANLNIVLRAYSHYQTDINLVLASPGSWILHILRNNPTQTISVTKFNDQVITSDEVFIEFNPELDAKVETNLIMENLHAFLLKKVLLAGACLPFDYFGKFYEVKVTDPTLNIYEDEDSISESMSDMSIAELVTSTPRKGHNYKRGLNFYITLTSSTILNYVQSQISKSDSKTVLKAGGFTKQIKILTEACNATFSSSLSKTVNGILLYGPPGVGKTLLTLNLCEINKCNHRVISGPEFFSKFYGETETKIRQIFDECTRVSPCILVLDDVDTIATRKEGEMGDQERRVVSTLQACFDKLTLNQSRVLVIATASKADCVPTSLRRSGRLDLEIELTVPSADARQEILNIHLKDAHHCLTEEEIQLIARETHGFVGADICNLFATSLLIAQQSNRGITYEDFQHARVQVKPSAMREVQVEVPSITWQHIGGLHDLKLKLKQAVDWPIKHPDAFIRMGIKPPHGVLMYGPPGCSKTMIAKALANESGLNFLSIKGPELFSKWVGESEKAVRDLFRRARSVAPSIIFFDEIDALGASRGTESGGSGGVAQRVLAQLLTEMDGVESLMGVTVLAATNRPDMLDRALLRPGRLDRVVYVPLPDLGTRTQVLKIHTTNIPLKNVDLEKIARLTNGYSGAELAALCNEAALASLQEHSEAVYVTDKHFETAGMIVKPRMNDDLIQIYSNFQNIHDKI